MAVDAQHIHHMWTRPTVDLNSPELTIFYRVLTAAHTPDSLEGAPPLPKHQLLVPARVPGLIRSSDMVKWERKQTSSAPDDDDSSDEENARITRRRVKGKKKPRDGEASTDVLATPLYTPFGEWAFAADHNMVNVKTLLVLGGSGTYSATLRSCAIAGRPLNVLSHSWSIKDSNQLSGFYQELALFKSSLHLRPLQGAVVPALVNVTRSALGASLNMVAPHPTFWMEASPDMPFVLKLHVIDAYTRLHAHGILHGNPQLRNMLICGDGRVKIVDFQSSRSLRPISIVGIHAANEADLELEMRQVRFKLDFGDARRYEEEKRQRARDIERRNNDRARLRKLVIRGLLHAQVDPDEGYTGNDQTHPPIPDAFWYDHWVDDVNRAPRRFVVPGKTQEEVTAALRHFESIVVKFQADYDQSWVDSGKRPGPSRSGRSPPEDDGLETILIGGSYVRRRRRSPTESSEVGGPTLTRPDTQEELARLIRETEAEAASATDWPFPSQVIGKTWNGRGVGVGDYGYDLPASSSPSSPPKAPIVRDYCTVGATRAPLLENPYRKKTTAKSEGISSGELPRASSTPSRPPKEVKAIDFVARPHNGVGGYYVRHAPTENRMSIERVRYIREQNRELAENMGFGPLYSTDDKYCLPPSFKRPPTDRPHWTSISIGTLKRRRECIIGREDYDDYPHVRKRAKTEGEEICDVRHIKTKDYVDVKADCSLVEPSQLGWRLASLGRVKRKQPGRQSIVKPARPRRVRKLPDTREFWTGEREPCLSPKLGPPKLPISENEPRAILGSFVYEALPRFHMRQLTSEHRRLVAKQDKGNKESTPPPPNLLAAANEALTPAPVAGTSASASASTDEASEDNEDMPYVTADDSAPYWPPVEEPRAAPTVSRQGAASQQQAHHGNANVQGHQGEMGAWFVRAAGMAALGCRVPPPPPNPRRRRREEEPDVPDTSSQRTQTVAVPSRPPAYSRRRPGHGPSHATSSSHRHYVHSADSSRSSTPGQRRSTPGPSRSRAVGPVTRQGPSDVPVYGSGATFSIPRLPHSPSDQPRVKRRRTDSSPTPPAPSSQRIVKEDSNDQMVLDSPERRPSAYILPKSYWSSLVGWFTGSN